MSRIVDDFAYDSAEDSDFTAADAEAAEAADREGNTEDEASTFEEEMEDGTIKKRKKRSKRSGDASKPKKFRSSAGANSTFPGLAMDFREFAKKDKNTRRIGAAVISSSDDEEDFPSAPPAIPEAVQIKQESAGEEKMKTESQDSTHAAAASTEDSVKSDISSVPSADSSSVTVPRPVSSSSNSLGALLAQFNKPKPKGAAPPKKVINWWDKPKSAAPKSAAPSVPPPVVASSIPGLEDEPPKASTESSAGRELTTGEVHVKEFINFAGETVEVQKKLIAGSAAEKAHREANKKKDNLSSILESLQNKKEVTTLEKSRIDWTVSKEQEGDAYELEQFTKDGFVEKQAFLLKADAKQYELFKSQKKRAEAAAAHAQRISEEL